MKKTPPKTVKIRVAVIVNELGQWSAIGYSGCSDVENMGSAIDSLDSDGAENRFFVCAELAVPTTPVVNGNVETAYED